MSAELETKLEDYSNRVVLGSYVLSDDEVSMLLEELKKSESNKISVPISNILQFSYGKVRSLKYERMLDVALPKLESATNAELVTPLTDLIYTFAQNADGMVTKLAESGFLNTSRKLMKVLEGPNKFEISLELRRVMFLLGDIQRHVAERKIEIAEILNKDTLDKHGLFNSLCIGKEEDDCLWTEPRAFFEKDKANTSDFTITILEVDGHNLIAKDKNGLSEPFLIIGAVPDYNQPFSKQIKSSTQKKTLNPKWDMTKEKRNTISVPANTEAILQVYDENLIGKSYMGSMHFSPNILYALQQAGKSSPMTSITLCKELRSSERAEKSKEAKYNGNVTGYLVVKMNISHY